MKINFIFPTYLWLLLLVPLTIGLSVIGRRGVNRARFWGGLALRSTVLVLIICALAGIQLRLRTDTLTTVFILDVSDSIPPTEKSNGEAFIRQAIQNMTSSDRAAIIVFGREALVERLPSEEDRLTEIASVPITIRTDIASALQLAQAIFPGEGAKRMVLLSDGRQNLGEALEQASLAAANGIELLYVSLGMPLAEAEVLVDSLDAPADVRQGQSFNLETSIHSTNQTDADLHIFIDGTLFQTQELHLQPGFTRIPIQIDSAALSEARVVTSSFHRFRVQIIPDVDNRLQNNEASAFTVVHGPPRILLVESQTSEGDNLAKVLSSAKMQVTRISPSEIPTSLSELAGYQAIILANVHAASLPASVMEILPVYVREMGMGLIMTGGQDSFGAGGYLRTPLEKALPVDMDVKDKELQANLALVLAVDKSGSMGRCHCNNPDLNQTYIRAEVGQPKVDIAKEAIMRAASALSQQDYLGIVAFDSKAHWAQRVARLLDPFALEQAIGTFQAEGSTNLETGVAAAYNALQNVSARRKHIILMTDGWVRQGDLTRLVTKMNNEGITLSIVAAGEGSAEYLAGLAQLGGGRYYPAKDILNVPDIFLKETVKSVGQYIVEGAFYPLPSTPGPVLRNLNTTALPLLLGYNGTTAKNTARLDLITPRGDPLLATWQYGLGRAAAWTSDLKGQWAKEWLTWESFPTFVIQLASWTLPAPQVEGLEAKATLENGQAVIKLQALDKEGRPLNFLKSEATIIDPELNATELPLEQVGAGHYQAKSEIASPGTYLVRLGVNQGDQSLGQITLGLVVPYSPEYKSSGTDRGLLHELASLTGGGELADPLLAFTHNLPARDFAHEIWRPLLMLAILLFPLDVATRRVMLGPAELRKAFTWLRHHLPTRSAASTPQPRILSRLFQARERARKLHAPLQQTPSNKPQEHLNTSLPPEKTQPSPSPTSSTELSQGDSLARLREAKKRAKR